MMVDEEILLETKNAKVRIIELSANTEAPWHYHTEVTDDCFFLEGNIEVHTQNPD